MTTVVKLARSAADDHALLCSERTVARLTRAGVSPAVLPRVRASGWAGEHRFVVEDLPAGTPVRADAPPETSRDALATIGAVHEATAEWRVWSADSFGASLAPHLDTISAAVRTPTQRRVAEAVVVALVAAFAERPQVTAVVHGDFRAGNVLVQGEQPARVSGVIGWERSASDAVPELDLVHFLLARRPGGLAAAVCASLGAPDTTVGEWAATVGVGTPNPSLGRAACTTWAWLAHAAAVLRRRRTGDPAGERVVADVSAVLDLLGRPGVLAGLARHGR